MIKFFIALIISFACLPNKVEKEVFFKNKINLSIYNQIIKNRPNINRKYAEELAHIIEKISKMYDLRANKFSAILAQESMYRLKVKNCSKNKCTDYGISQINIKNIKAYNLDKERLTTDLEYSIQAGAIILSDIKRKYSKKENDYWTRYNTSNPIKRKIYKKLVMRYM